MSVDYAAGLSDYDDLGVCGLDEVFDEFKVVEEKVQTLANLLRQFKGSCVVHAGAGLSTAAGIPDFRGKRGVWTKKLQSGETEITTKLAGASDVKCEGSTSATTDDQLPEAEFKPFDQTEPTFSHRALGELCREGFVSHIISQNVDGLFLKSNLPRKYISELHGNFYLDECTKCRFRFIRSSASTTMRLQRSVVKCPRGVKHQDQKLNDQSVGQRQCKGHLRDTILDWESPIPFNELRVAERESKRNKLHVCIGTSMQLKPSKDLVRNSARSKTCKLVVINLQPTQLDAKASLVINYYADEVMKQLMEALDLRVPPYDPVQDPTKRNDLIGTPWLRSA